jgi:tripartite-type tricarboxylate transporter receptor subunit TctC
MKFRRILALITALVVGVVPFAAHAEFPDRPIRLIVPWAPGGSTDVTARALAKAAEPILGQPIVIINVPGASTSIGMGKLAREAPDGYTVGVLSSAAYNFEFSGQKVPYDTINGFTYVSYYGDNLIGVVVLNDSPLKSMADLMAASKKRRLTYATAGLSSTQSLMGIAIQRATHGQLDLIPMNGSAGSLTAILGRQVDFMIETSVWQPYVANGQMRLLALNTQSRSKRYPDVPSLPELGLPSLRSVQAIVAPPGVPEAVRAKLESAFLKATADPSFAALMDGLSMDVVGLPGKEAQALVAREYQKAKSVAEAEGSAPK